MLLPAYLFQPIPLPNTYVHRRRLDDLFEQYEGTKVLLVQATAGYGKSVAVAGVIQRFAFPVIWYPLEKIGTATPLLFMWNLVHAIRTVFPVFGKQVEALIEETLQLLSEPTGRQWMHSTVLPALLSEMSQIDAPLKIVLDDYHQLVGDEIDMLFGDLVEYCPANVSFIVTSRTSPDWSARPRWEGRGMFASISEETLAFTMDESRELAERLSVPLPLQQVEAIYNHIGGWPILHYLLYKHCQGKTETQVHETLNLLTQPNNTIYEYLAGELLDEKSETMRDFLCRTSVLNYLDAKTCDALLDIKNSDSILTQLRSDLFVKSLSGSPEPRFVHSHQIMRRFLRDTLRRRYDSGVVYELYTRLGHIQESRQEWDQALESYCQTEDCSLVAGFIYRQFPYLISTSQLYRLETWLRYIPPSWQEQNPVLLACQGIILGNRKENAAEKYLQRAIAQFAEQGNSTGVYWASVELGWVYWILRKCRDGVAILQKIVKETSMPSEVRTQAFIYLCMSYHCVDDFPNARIYGEQAIQLCRAAGTKEGDITLVRILRLISNVYNSMGRHRESMKTLQEAHSLAQEMKLGDWSLAWINAQLAVKYQNEGNFAEAHKYLDEAEILLEKYRKLGSESDLFNYILITRGHLYRDGAYNYKRAEECYRQAERGHPNGVFLALRLAQSGFEQEALQLAWQRWQAYQDHESPVTRALYQGMVGLAYLNLGDFERAHDFLVEAENTLERHTAIYGLMTTRLYLARVYLALGEQAKARQCLQYSLQQMQASGYYHLDWWHPWSVAKMCAYAIREGIEADFAERLVIKRLSANHLDPFFPLLNASKEAVRVTAMRILEQLGDATQLQAWKMIDMCGDNTSREQFRKWLSQGWLTPIGLIRLRDFLSWKQVEVFLLWISPNFQGSEVEIGQAAYIAGGTVKKHIQAIKQTFKDKLTIDFSGKGAHSLAYDWAIRQKIVNPVAFSPELHTLQLFS